ncbi:hypothetical protein CNMCM5793_001545 [Aspergillus hiratsukae]|uniref:Ankyrin repeat protein n=1 Tax=Aspergillus hiratsukae TaxID=1194566 RepID=A0A8H6PBC2_9EURO|nr:hypothetical protein CNMCM5793_001545 [Aspergillus hiratsukae]KAF7167355.1 hypothetical protein CNMCM6106_002930 [Aspergillus hiratsukae]
MSLHKAVRKNHLPEVRRLVEAGEEVNSKDSDGNTPLMLAAETSYAVTEFLLENGAVESFLWRNRLGYMAIDKAYNSVCLSGDELGMIMRIILEYKAAIEDKLSDSPGPPIPDEED